MAISRLLLELISCLFIGYNLGKKYPDYSSEISSPLIAYGIPLSLTGLLLKIGLNSNLLNGMLMSLLVISILMLISLVIIKVTNKSLNRCLFLGSFFGNSGYIGIPIALSLLPNDFLSLSMGYDLGATLLVWLLGPYLLTDTFKCTSAISSFYDFSSVLFSSPAVKGLLATLIILLTPWSYQIGYLLWFPSRVIIILAIVIVGMRLSFLSSSNKSFFVTILPSLKVSLILKLFALPALMWTLCDALNFSSLSRSALVLQAGTPTAISVALLAEASNYEKESASSLVFSSTIISLITIPFWALILNL